MLALDRPAIEAVLRRLTRDRVNVRVRLLTRREWFDHPAVPRPEFDLGYTYPTDAHSLEVGLPDWMDARLVNETLWHELAHVGQFADFPTTDDAMNRYSEYPYLMNPFEHSAEAFALRNAPRQTLVREA